MILRCDFCMEKYDCIVKVPCGYTIESNDTDDFFLVQRIGEESYSNICITCLFNNSGEKGNNI